MPSEQLVSRPSLLFKVTERSSGCDGSCDNDVGSAKEIARAHVPSSVHSAKPRRPNQQQQTFYGNFQ